MNNLEFVSENFVNVMLLVQLCSSRITFYYYYYESESNLCKLNIVKE